MLIPMGSADAAVFFLLRVSAIGVQSQGKERLGFSFLLVHALHAGHAKMSASSLGSSGET